MSITITSNYDSLDQMRNTKEDLIGTGIPRELIFLDEDNLQIKVLSPLETEAEIEEILKRHNAKATSVSVH